MMNEFYSKEPFLLESGVYLPELKIAYHTYGRLNESGTNVVWICHALTANSDAVSWWPGIVGEACIINPSEHFIVCANILGSCYGTTGPQSIDPATGQPYLGAFPAITIRDMVQAHILLRQHLGIRHIALLAGGSMGGYQAMEWALTEPDLIERLFLLATSPAESAWGIAIHTAQRLAITADDTWNSDQPGAGARGLKAARAIGMLTYRNYKAFGKTQHDPDTDKTDNFKAASYIDYQGEKLVRRFHPVAYYVLTKAMDSHNIARKRNKTMETVLQQMSQPTLLCGISSDILCPVEEQRFMAAHLPDVAYHEIESDYGHDGFLIEAAQISALLKKWWQQQ